MQRADYSFVIENPGGPDALSRRPLAPPLPAPGEALVRHTAIGLNFIDCYHRSGLYPLPQYPHALGMEAVGVIEALAPAENGQTYGFEVGARVAYATLAPGAYCTVRRAPLTQLVPVPADLPDDVVAATLLKGMTVEYLVQRTFAPKPGQTVLWHAAAGGVGALACQWLRALGVRTIGTVSSQEKAVFARERGCDEVVVYREGEGFADRVLELTQGAGVPVVYDSVGRATFNESLRCLAPRGVMVSFGNASGAPAPVDLQQLARGGSLFVTRPRLGDYVATRADLLASAGALFDRLLDGRLSSNLELRLPLSEVADAHRLLEARGTRGASVLIP
jgi:NADPH:quinone reductase